MAAGGAAPRAGDVFAVGEPDYRYGIGPVVARVQEVHGRVEYHGEPWWHVAAATANGTPARHGGWQDRDLYLRETALDATRITLHA
jgi:hypothetical protein